jgi:nitrate reductase gamma subunit
MAWTILLVVGAITIPIGMTVDGLNVWGQLIYYLTVATGISGLALGALGSGALFLRRLFDNTLKKHTTPQEYFNLLLIFAALVTGIMTWGTDLSFGTAREVTGSLITFSPFTAATLQTINVTLVNINVILVGIMLIYIPISKMSHYVGKYFTFHKVLWDNDPNLKGSAIDHQVKKASTFKPTTSWSAPHIKPPTAPGK